MEKKVMVSLSVKIKNKDVFVHHTAVADAWLKYLSEGDELTFEVEDGEKGPSAVNLQKA